MTDLIKNMIALNIELKTDSSYYESWKSNIAMSYIDAENSYRKKTNKKFLNNNDKHIIANNAADNFLKLLIK